MRSNQHARRHTRHKQREREPDLLMSALKLAAELRDAGHGADASRRAVFEWVATRGLDGARAYAIAIRAHAQLAARSDIGAGPRPATAFGATPRPVRSLSRSADWGRGATPARAIADDARFRLDAATRRAEVGGTESAWGASMGAFSQRNAPSVWVAATPGVYALQMSAREDADVELAREADPDEIRKRLGPGRPLSLALRIQLGPRLAAFGVFVTLSKVRVHDDAIAAALCAELGAEAFTTGHHIAFAPGYYREDADGVALLAHELTHVWQQTRGQAPPGVDMAPALEVEARRVGAGVHEAPVPTPVSADGGGLVDGSSPGGSPAVSTQEADVGGREQGAIQRQETPGAVKPKRPKSPLRAARDLGTPEWMAKNAIPAWLASENAPYEEWSEPVWLALGLPAGERVGHAKGWFDRTVREAVRVHLEQLCVDLKAVRFFDKTQARTKEQMATASARRVDFLENKLERREVLYRAISAIVGEHTALGAVIPEPAQLAEIVWNAPAFPCRPRESLPKRWHSYINEALFYLEAALPSFVKRRAAGLEAEAEALPDVVKNAAADVCLAHQAWFTVGALDGFVAMVHARLPDPKVMSLDELKGKSLLILGAGEVGALTRTIWNANPTSPDAVDPIEKPLADETPDMPWKVKLQTWMGEGRPFHLAVFDIPTWHYYTKNIVPFTFMNFSTPKRNGVHREIAARLPMVDRQIEKRRQNKEGGPEKRGFYGFRFMAKPGPAEHLRGRAIDTGAIANPHVANRDTVTLLNLLTGSGETLVGERGFGDVTDRRSSFETLFAAGEDTATARLELSLQKRKLVEERRSLDYRVAANREARANLQSEIDALSLQEVELDEAVAVGLTTLGAIPDVRAVQINDALRGLHVKLKNAWASLGGPGANIDAIAERIAPMIRAAKSEFENSATTSAADRASKKLARDNATSAHLKLAAHRKLADREIAKKKREGQNLTPAQISAIREHHKAAYLDAKHLATQAKAAYKAAPSPYKMRKRLEDLASLEAALATPAGREKLLGKTSKSSAPTSMAQLESQGFSNLPDHLVQGFAECGWRWGGEWAGNRDSMHFEYTKDVSDAKPA